MKKRVTYILFFLLFVIRLHGQTLICPGGNLLENKLISINYCIGEIAVNMLSSSSYATIGFLQPSFALKTPNNDSPIIVYQFLSPNLDGDNDTFQIEGLPTLVENEVLVFDRTGSKVFYAKNYDNSWDGGNLPEGNYFYVVKVPSKKLEFKGGLVIAK